MIEDLEKDRLTICPPGDDGEISIEINDPDGLRYTFLPFETLENLVKAVRADIKKKDGEALVNQPMGDDHPAWVPFEKWKIERWLK